MKENHLKPKKKHGKALLGYTILILLLAAAIRNNQDFFREVVQQVRHISPFLLLLSCLAAVLYRWLDGYFLYFLGRRYQSGLKLMDGLKAAFCGSFFRVTTFGSGMGISKMYYLTHDGVPLGNSMGITLLQTIYYKAAVWVLGVLSLLLDQTIRTCLRPYQSFVLAGVLIALLLLAFFLIVAVNRKLTGVLFRQAYRIASHHEKWIGWLEKADEQVSLLQTEAAEVVRKKKLGLYLFLISLLQQGLLYLIPYLGCGNTSVPFLTSFAMTATAYMLAGIIPLPGGFGSLDVVFTLLFARLTNAPTAATAMVIFRFTSTFVPFFIGAIPVMIPSFSRKRSSINKES